MTRTATPDIKSGALYAYICYALSIVLPIAAIAGIIINFIKRDGSEGTWVASHHRWMMRTFFFSLLWSLVLLVLSVVPIVNILVIFAFIALAIWYIYRVMRGFLAYNSEKAMYGGVMTAAVATFEAGA